MNYSIYFNVEKNLYILSIDGKKFEFSYKEIENFKILLEKELSKTPVLDFK